jgi:endonuclease/exonuclease/phosphatase family metal-dependent hydrolase
LAIVAALSDPVAQFAFDGDLASSVGNASIAPKGQQRFIRGLEGMALEFTPGRSDFHALVTGLPEMTSSDDFTVLFWVRSSADSANKMVVVSQKVLPDNSLESQKNEGWAFSSMHGTWAWNVGSGNRRLNYQRENGYRMPINDGRWHQVAMSYDSSTSLFRLYFDGANWATYNIEDSGGFSFDGTAPFMLGQPDSARTSNIDAELIRNGREDLQKFVDLYHSFGLPKLKPEEFIPLVVDPGRITKQNAESAGISLSDEQVDSIESLASGLMRNPYTIHQSIDYMEVALLPKVYRLEEGEIKINYSAAEELISNNQLSDSDFDLDNLTIWDRTVSTREISRDYTRRFPSRETGYDAIPRVVAGAFNIYHGGIHHSIEQHGWDSRDITAQVIAKHGVDLVMMQETYSAGDYISAELGYYFATTVDWDNLNQGANISVLSRYPIEEITVPPNSAFMNVSALVRLSSKQRIYVMSNWYGMRNFPDVFEFHKDRFGQSDSIPVLFGGDFNAVPPTDGGSSQAYDMLTAAGFIDAFRELHPDPEASPGYSHRSGRRIDQLYYKGSALKNTSTEVISTWPSLFPSDHYLIRSEFELDYRTER